MKNIIKSIFVVVATVAMTCNTFGQTSGTEVGPSNIGREFVDAIDVGNNGTVFEAVDTRDSRYYDNYFGNQYGGQKAVFYTFTIDEPMDLIIHNFGSELYKTNLSLIKIDEDWMGDKTVLFLAQSGDSYSAERELGVFSHKYDDVVGSILRQVSYETENQALICAENLEPGTYYVVVQSGIMSNSGGLNGVLRTSFYGMAAEGSSMKNLIDIGSYGNSISYSDQDRCLEYYVPSNYGIAGIHYKLNLTTLMNLNIINNSTDGKIEILNSDKKVCVSSESYDRGVGEVHQISELLPAGTYYIVSNVSQDLGLASLSVTGELGNFVGDSKENPIVVSSSMLPFSDTMLCVFYPNSYVKTKANDVYYKLVLGSTTNISVNSNGEYIAMLNGAGNEIIAPVNHSISLVMDAGTYYILSGNSTNVRMNLVISGSVVAEGGVAFDTNRNFVLTTTPLVAMAEVPDAVNANQVRQSVKYYDGLGRLFEGIEVGMGPDGRDLVTMQQYDKFGRDSKSWLTTSHLSTGRPVEWYGVSATACMQYGDTRAYGEPVYDNSGLNRVSAVVNPGDAWGERAVKSDYLFNASAGELACIRFDAAGGKDNPTLVCIGFYEANLLNVVRGEDENGGISYTFTDRLGRKLLVRQVGDNGEFLDTYWVYDDFGNVSFVLPPKASTGASSGDVGDNVLKLAFCYRYDHRNRCIGKRIPDTDWTYFVYDNADRQIFSQTGEQRKAGKWSYTVSDALGRVAVAGIYTGSVTPNDFADKNVIATYNPSSGSYTISGNFPTSGLTPAMTNFYDNYSYKAGAGFSASLNYAQAMGYGARYGSDGDNLTAKGMLTGSIVYQADSSTPQRRAFYYDYKRRVIQTRTTNHIGGVTVVDNNYDYVGNLIASKESHSDNVGATNTLASSSTFDKAGRVLSGSATLNNSTAASVTYGYDRLGRLTSTTYGNGYNETMSYNTRGWLTAKMGDHFAMNLRYHNPTKGAKAQWSGNIAEWEWSNGNGQHTYAISYDAISRFTGAELYQDNTKTNRFTEQGLSYDKNGNITTLQRTALGAIRDSYAYAYNGNQLLSINNGPNYTYDDNGNMTFNGKDGLAFEYNELNLVKKVSKGGTTSGNFVYLYDGTKLRAENGAGQGFDYLGSLVYNRNGANSTLESAAFGAGRIVKTSTGYDVRYFLTDHLGSVRASIRDKANGQGSDVIDRSDYQLLGERWAGQGIGATTNRYQFNGKESQTLLGLNLLDYGARHYDPNIGRWFTPDPLAEKYNSMSPYLYCAANPIKFIDPDGRYLVDAKGRNMWNRKTGQWNEYATQDAIRIGNAMRMTDIGVKAFNRLVNSSTAIKMMISQDVVREGSGFKTGEFRGSHDVYSDGSIVTPSGTITIYEGSLREAINEAFVRYNNNEELDPEMLLIITLLGDILEGAIGSVAVHESEHTTKENIKQAVANEQAKNNNKSESYDLETKPNNIQNEYLRELHEKQKLTPDF